MNRFSFFVFLLFFSCATTAPKRASLSSEEFFASQCLNFKNYDKIQGNAWIKLNWGGYQAQFPATVASDRAAGEVKIEGSNLIGEPQFFLHATENKVSFRSFVKTKDEGSIQKLVASIPSQILFSLFQSRVPCDLEKKNTRFVALDETGFQLTSPQAQKSYRYRFRHFLEKYWLENMEITIGLEKAKGAERYVVEWGDAQNTLFIPKKFKIRGTSKQLEVLWRDVTAN